MALKTSQMNYNKGKYHKKFDSIFDKHICTDCIFRATCDFKDGITENTCVIHTKVGAI